jgi:hypothetical protein
VNKLVTGFFVLAAVLLALPASSHAQSPLLNGIGSSGLFLEVGEAAFAGAGGTCAWSTSTASLVVATDTSTGSALTDTGNSWVVWVPTGGNDCSSNATPASVWSYLQTDSVVGDRCLFNGALSTPSCTISYGGAAGAAPSGLIEGGTEVNLPAAVAQVLSGGSGFPGLAPNYSGTDIRAEDAEFATTRALTPCGSVVGTGHFGSVTTNQYLGLGYNNGDSIMSDYSSSVFHVISFSLPSNFFTQPVGADPILVAVNSTDAVGVGFNSPNITNLNRSTLALFLDGSVGETRDALQPEDPETTSKPVTVLVREPLSGTYNTMEYNGPNTVMLQTSQDVGANQPASQQNCSGSAVLSNPMSIENTHFGSFRNRAIGTGQELKETFAINDALGYGFWGVSNFAAAPNTAKYLTIDGVDPLFPSYNTLLGVIPTTSAQLAKITFTHMKDGTYPIWSLLRLVYVNSSLATPILNLAEAAGTFSTSAHPDFVPFYAKSGLTYIDNFKVERSHFTPPGIGYTTAVKNPACKTDPTAQSLEAGGDVGGVPIPCNVDVDYNTTTGAFYTNRRN